MRIWNLKWFSAVGLVLVSAALSLAGGGREVRADRGTNHYKQTNLVSDIANPPGGPAAHLDSNLVNPWGIASNSSGPFWVADNNAGVSTAYNSSGATAHPPVTIPPPPGSPAGSMGTPTGVVFNSASGDFVVKKGMSAGQAVFLWATEDGTIAGWNPGVDPNNAIIVVDNSTKPTPDNGAVYKGLALDYFDGHNYLYATNFRAGTVDVFDSRFNQVRLPGSFSDPSIPAGFAPFGIQRIGDDLYVTYAKQDAAKHDDVRGPGFGFVDIFDASGRLDRRFASQGALNAPWGIAVAPDNFGAFSRHILIGNFGDGRISAFDTSFGTGRFDGQLQNTSGQPLSIPGLWGIRVGNGGSGGNEDTLYFAAGINRESDGLFGALTPASR